MFTVSMKFAEVSEAIMNHDAEYKVPKARFCSIHANCWTILRNLLFFQEDVQTVLRAKSEFTSNVIIPILTNANNKVSVVNVSLFKHSLLSLFSFRQKFDWTFHYQALITKLFKCEIKARQFCDEVFKVFPPGVGTRGKSLEEACRLTSRFLKKNSTSGQGPLQQIWNYLLLDWILSKSCRV